MKKLPQPSTTKHLSNLNRKCGEITYCIQVGKRVYALNCLYCPQICLQWDIFINHMEQEHDEDLNCGLQPESIQTEPQIDNVQEDISENLQQNKITPTTFNKIKEPNRFPFIDPLEEADNSTNSMSLESSIKIEKIDCTSIHTMTDDLQYNTSEDDKNEDAMDYNTQFIRNDENQSIEFIIKEDIKHIKEQLNTNNRLMEQLFAEIKLIQHNKVSLPSTTDSSLRNDSDLTRPNIVNSATAKPSTSYFTRNELSTTTDMLQKQSHLLNISRILPKTPFVSKEEFLKFEEKIHESEENFANLTSEEGYDWIELNDDISLQSSASCNDGHNNENKHFVYDKIKLTEIIINNYKNYPVLWQTNRNERTNVIKHQEAYKKITKLINKEMNLNLKCIQIKGKINKLRSKFRKEHELLTAFTDEIYKNCNESDMECDEFSTPNGQRTASWLYKNMSFLKDHINNGKKRSKRGTKALTNDKNYLPLAKFSFEENQQFVELYKSYPCLWDVNHIGYRFKNLRQESLQELLEAVNNGMTLKLSLKELQKKIYVIRYAITQEKHRKIKCEKLKAVFTPQCQLYNELLFLKDSVGPFKCEYCDKIFNGPDQYKVHKSSHDGSMPYTCPQCKKGFMRVGNCTVHLRRHTKDYQFECQECGKKFPTSTDLNVHSRHHTGEKPYICDICGQSFRTWTYFDSHRRRHEKNPNHKCSLCSKGFYEHNKLKQHMKSHMNLRDKVCDDCGKSFTCTKYLNQHKLTHAEKKKYSCKICGKMFAQRGALSNHTKSHGIVANKSNNSDVVEFFK